MPQSTEMTSRAPALDRGRLQAIAVVDAIRHEVHDAAAEQLDRPPQDDSRRHAVDVVVAMDGDRLGLGDRGEQPIDRLAHAGQQKGIVELCQLGMQKALRRLRIGEAALAQQPCDDRWEPQRRGGLPHARLIGGHVLPDARQHHRA
jgi:hypothetical protein